MEQQQIDTAQHRLSISMMQDLAFQVGMLSITLIETCQEVRSLSAVTLKSTSTGGKAVPVIQYRKMTSLSDGNELLIFLRLVGIASELLPMMAFVYMLTAKKSSTIGLPDRLMSNMYSSNLMQVRTWWSWITWSGRTTPWPI
jgi:hypothetical protein